MRQPASEDAVEDTLGQGDLWLLCKPKRQRQRRRRKERERGKTDREGDSARHGDPLFLLMVRLRSRGGRVGLAPQVLLQHVVGHREKPLCGHLAGKQTWHLEDTQCSNQKSSEELVFWSTGSSVSNTCFIFEANWHIKEPQSDQDKAKGLLVDLCNCALKPKTNTTICSHKFSYLCVYKPFSHLCIRV